jgi:hypothetical protein
MAISYRNESQWSPMATIEVGENCEDLAALVADESLDFRLQPAAQSPAGYRWFDLTVDASKGERRCARTAFALLSAMQRIADKGGIPDFRIVRGHHWLQLGPQDQNDNGDLVLRTI